MEEDFIYWRHPTLPGIKVEEISGGETRKGATWLEMARQVYCENGRDSYREIGHFHNGAPFLFGEQSRISVTHCPGLLAVATLPSTPEVELGVYSRRAALGIDAERSDRRQVLDVRERFLSERELEMIPADDVRMNILAWTLKEAAYKAAFCEGLDLRRDIAIEKMPVFGPPTIVYDKKEFDTTGKGAGFGEEGYGLVSVRMHRCGEGAADRCEKAGDRNDGSGSDNNSDDFDVERLKAFSYLSDDFVVSLVFSPQCAKFGKSV